jgi:hypothetical protein
MAEHRPSGTARGRLTRGEVFRLKASFYDHFKSKEVLVVELVKLHETMLLDSLPLDGTESPAKRKAERCAPGLSPNSAHQRVNSFTNLRQICGFGLRSDRYSISKCSTTVSEFTYCYFCVPLLQRFQPFAHVPPYVRLSILTESGLSCPGR